MDKAFSGTLRGGEMNICGSKSKSVIWKGGMNEIENNSFRR